MTQPISTLHNWQKITPDDGHYFFGYYDRNPWNKSMTRHLAMKIDQIERLPERGETAEIGTVDRTGNWTPLIHTRTWCHQQGCMELFLPHLEDGFCFNDYDPASDRIVARIYQMGQGITGSYSLPVYAISPDGKWAVSLNFSRIPRRGYSYADAVLAADSHPADPDADGLWLINLQTGETRLIVSYRRMMELHPYGYGLSNQYIWLNHAIFNCDSSRILWLFRQCPEELKYNPKWETYLYTCALDGNDAECVLSQSQWRDYISHQIWGRTPREILVDASWGGQGHDAIVFDESRRPWIAERISRSHGAMAHMIFSPDGKTLLADSYPDEDSNQKLILIDAATGDWELLGTFHHEATPIGETRCDLHPRWSTDGKTITIDSTHDGKRGIYLLNL